MSTFAWVKQWNVTEDITLYLSTIFKYFHYI